MSLCRAIRSSLVSFHGNIQRVVTQSFVAPNLPIAKIQAYTSTSEEDLRPGEGITDAETDADLEKDSAAPREDYRSWVEDMLTGTQGREVEGEKPESSQLATTAAQSQTADASETSSIPGDQGIPLSDNAATQSAATQALVHQSKETLAQRAPIMKAESPVQHDDDEQRPQEESIPEMTSSNTAVKPLRTVPTRITMRETASILPDAVLGYRNVGLPADANLGGEEGRISARTFWPGTLYDPEDLVNPASSQYNKSNQSSWMMHQATVKKATNAEAVRQADFKNVKFLHRFTSASGQLPSRRVTKLQKKVHVHVMKQIKIARNMALLPTQGKLEEETDVVKRRDRKN